MAGPRSRVTSNGEIAVDQMPRLAKAVAFICGPAHAATVALNKAVISRTPQDIKDARGLFDNLNPRQQRAALTLIADPE
jgi:hypothetical protein